MTGRSEGPADSDEILFRVCGAALREGSMEAIEAALAQDLTVQATQPVSSEETEVVKRALVRTLARLWAPMIASPANQFRPMPVKEPERNDPCLCGSDFKFKKCCRPLLAEVSWTMTVEEFWPYVLYLLSPDERALLPLGETVPVHALRITAQTLARERRYDETVKLLAPLFSGTLHQVDSEAASAFEVLCKAYRSRGDEEAEARLVQRIYDQAPRSPLRAAAVLRLLETALDARQFALASTLLGQAQKDDPGNPWLSMHEITLLLAQDKIKEARERAKFWAYRLERMAKGDAASSWTVLQDFMSKVATDPIEAYAQLGREEISKKHPEQLDWVSRLEALVIAGTKRPIPRQYRLMRLGETESPGASASVLAPAFWWAETPAEILALERAWQELLPQELLHPNGNASMDTRKATTREVLASGTGEYLLAFIEQHPEVFDSLRILDTLGAICALTAFAPLIAAHRIVPPLLDRGQRIATTVLAQLPCTERFALQDERNAPLVLPFHRRLHQFVIDQHIGEMFDIVGFLLRLDPSDPHALRAQMTVSCLRADRDVLALTLARRHADTELAVVRFGEVLALWRLGSVDEAAVFAARLARDTTEAVSASLAELRALDPHATKAPRARTTDQRPIQLIDHRDALLEEWWRTRGSLEWLRTVTA